MKTAYKHISFISNEMFQGKPRYTCINNKTTSPLADVFWYKSWKKFCITFREETVFDEGCLRDIADFLDELKKADKNK